MRRFSLIVGVGAVVALLGVAAAKASNPAQTRLVVTAVQTDVAEVANGQGRLGARFVGADDLVTEGRKVGRGVRSCELLAAGADNSGTFQCLLTLTLEKGTITLQAMPTLSERGFEAVKAAVTGGTGTFRHARGEALVQELSPTETRYTIDLR